MRLLSRTRLKSWFFQNDLTKLAELYYCSKTGEHSYTPIYQRHFAHLKDKPITLLEIGVGGWDDPHKGGNSLRMWEAFFRRGKVYGIDIAEKKLDVKTFKGSQVDENFLLSVIKEIGPPDIIIDDGSHYTHHVIESFKILFPLLAENGIYVIEDLQTSYWPSTDKEDWNGSEDVNAPTSMNYLKSLVDGLNHAERPGYKPNYFDLNILSMSFYHNLCFIQKGKNDEPSNMV